VPQQQLVGRLGRDPFYLYFVNEPSVAGFPLAINDERGQTTWHKVRVFGEVADQVQAGLQARRIKKGSLVQVTGLPVTREEDNGRGGTRKSVEFHASEVVRLTTPTVPHPQGR
jgi:single-stranded DNA-binding protein